MKHLTVTSLAPGERLFSIDKSKQTRMIKKLKFIGIEDTKVREQGIRL